MSVVGKIVASTNLFEFACLNAENAIDIYRQFRDLPKTFTRKMIKNALHINVNGPCFGSERPFLLSAVDENGLPKVVKILRIDNDRPINVDIKRQEIDMEAEVCKLLDLAACRPELALVQVEVHNVEVTSDISSAVGVGSGKFQALLMPTYARTLTDNPMSFENVLVRQGHRLIEALEFMHSHELTHNDIKGDNIFISYTGDWYLGDFGSSKRVGETITSSTDSFYFEPLVLVSKPASKEIDYFMFLVTLLIETLEKKQEFREIFYNSNAYHISYDKVIKYCETLSQKNNDLSTVLTIVLQNIIH